MDEDEQNLQRALQASMQPTGLYYSDLLAAKSQMVAWDGLPDEYSFAMQLLTQKQKQLAVIWRLVSLTRPLVAWCPA